jgi:ribosome-associated protein
VTTGSRPLTRKAAPQAPVADPATPSSAPPSSAPKRASRAKTAAPPPLASLEELILARLDEDKAQDILLIDLKGKSSMADAMVIASGRSQRHVGALADHLTRAIKDAGHGKAPVEGMPQCDWVLIDAGDVIVHLFRPEVRAFYNIEKIWSVDTPSRHLAAN